MDLSSIQNFNPPQLVISNNKQFKFKQKLSNSFSYRCGDRKNCSCLAKFSEENLKSWLNNQELFLLVPEKLNHDHSKQCLSHTFINSINNFRNNNPELININFNQVPDLIKSQMRFNCFKPYNWLNNLLLNNIISFDFNKIKYYVDTLRDLEYPKDNTYLSNISKYLSKITENDQEVATPFCLSKLNFYNFNNKKFDNIIIYSTSYQIKIFSQTHQIFLDCTFKIVPNNFYQLLIIHGVTINGNILLLFYILLTSNNEEIYLRTFNEIKNILRMMDLTPKFIQIHCDFEIGLKNAFFKSFNEIKINFYGCWFHYIKSLYSNIKNSNLFLKRLRNINKKLINILKYLPFINEDLRKKFF